MKFEKVREIFATFPHFSGVFPPFHLENLRVFQGFDGRPPALESMDPLLDLGMTGNAKMAKKASALQSRNKQGFCVSLQNV